MGTLGVGEMAVIFILALVLFGPKKLPELGKTIGKAMTEFRRASNDLKATFDREMHSLERENQSLQQATRKVTREIADTVSYEHPPADTSWNPLDQEQTATQPATVGASEVSGAESNGTTPTTAPAIAPAIAPTPAAAEPAPAIEGTVPRGAGQPEPASQVAEAEPVPPAAAAPEKTQNS